MFVGERGGLLYSAGKKVLLRNFKRSFGEGNRRVVFAGAVGKSIGCVLRCCNWAWMFSYCGKGALLKKECTSECFGADSPE